eukprot:234697-Hanusia_phi.AAC.1
MLRRNSVPSLLGHVLDCLSDAPVTSRELTRLAGFTARIDELENVLKELQVLKSPAPVPAPPAAAPYLLASHDPSPSPPVPAPVAVSSRPPR